MAIFASYGNESFDIFRFDFEDLIFVVHSNEPFDIYRLGFDNLFFAVHSDESLDIYADFVLIIFSLRFIASSHLTYIHTSV